MKREIIVVEDVKAQADILSRNLVQQGFTEPDWTITIWHVNSASSYEAHLKKAAECEARIMIADLRLVDPGEQAPIDIAREYARAKCRQDDTVFWDWETEERKRLLPGAALIEAFVESSPGEKHVLLATDHRANAKTWYPTLRACTEDLGGHMDQTGLVPDVVRFIRRAYEDWPVTLWSERTAKWFDGYDHNPANREREKIIADEQLHRLWSWTRAVLNCEPPRVWFDDEEQFQCLFHSLKGLTGSHSCANGRGPYNLFLQNCPFLVGFALREQKVPSRVASQILSDVRFDRSLHPLLPQSQDAEDAKSGIRELVRVVGESFVWHRDQSNAVVLENVNLDGDSASLTMGFDCDRVSPGRTLSFRQKVEATEHTGLQKVRALIIPQVKWVVEATPEGATKLVFRP